MRGRGSSARTTCPACPRQVAVARTTERIHPHNDPSTGERCAATGQRIDLYGDAPADADLNPHTEGVT
ncbi:hypothetical protein [Verrucosispora sp. WMMC514]|uniref:hypothetical protein n=1 Tax=Verrucosispora sp. WMMC514 TaxID=3015156 RepID=UPI00248CF25D|nr:hypothetical protein [Verrucosispora sp. WMMC514]WBB94241.1 hypothetical protein O7597_15430 [Verrucosispora sp. WMMC514]